MSKIALVDIDGVLADWMGLRTKLQEICQASNKGYPLNGDINCKDLWYNIT